MGEAKNKKQRFLAKHPYCCFCGGDAVATTIDHVPARTCFPERAYPEGFEFPACSPCQTASRLDELAFGFYARAFDVNDDNYRLADLRKAFAGLRNNLPHLMPNFSLNGRDKRRSLRDMGWDKPPHLLASELPVVGVPVEAHSYIQRYARKIACALFYREQGRPAPLSHQVWTMWNQATNKRAMEGFETFISMTPFITKGWRPNLDFGDRFGYRSNKSDKPDIFAAIAQFGGGLVLPMIVVEPEAADRIDRDDWVAVRDMFD